MHIFADAVIGIGSKQLNKLETHSIKEDQQL
jgi:hypothetical protein